MPAASLRAGRLTSSWPHHFELAASLTARHPLSRHEPQIHDNAVKKTWASREGGHGRRDLRASGRAGAQGLPARRASPKQHRRRQRQTAATAQRTERLQQMRRLPKDARIDGDSGAVGRSGIDVDACDCPECLLQICSEAAAAEPRLLACLSTALMTFQPHSAESAAGTAGEHVTVWRANMRELTRRLKLEACVQLVADKHGPLAAGAVLPCCSPRGVRTGSLSRCLWAPSGAHRSILPGAATQQAQRPKTSASCSPSSRASHRGTQASDQPAHKLTISAAKTRCARFACAYLAGRARFIGVEPPRPGPLIWMQ